ncbi:MAG: hypothetical protein WD847_10530 [Pirellulales bacterium]
MRVISQEGNPGRLLAADLEGYGRDHLIVVNTRMSRLDLYRWLPADQRGEPAAGDPQRPNELPMAPDWHRSELPLDELPLDVAIQDLNGDNTPELVVLSSPSNKVLAYEREGPDKWRKTTTWDLLPGNPAGRTMLLVRQLPDSKFELLISLDQGIQTLRLEPGSRPGWLSPREGRGRLDMKLLDLDGDGDLDVVEWSSQARQTIRWFECRDGKLLPAQVLFDQAVQGIEALAIASQPAELLLLGGPQQGLLRRYTLARGEQRDLGRQESLPMAGGASAVWCGMMLGERPALIAADPSQPRLRVQALGDSGWLDEQSFPSIGNLRALAAVQAQPGKLLLWAKDASDLYQSSWESGRLTYPEPFPQSADVKDRRILALESVGGSTWWTQRVGDAIDLYVWKPGEATPTQTRFAGLGAKVERARWLGGQRLLIQDAYSQGARLVQLADGNVSVTEPSHLARLEFSEFVLLNHQGQPRPGRLSNGVLEWLGDDLHSVDQVMLSEGQRLASFVPVDDGSAWALEQGGGFLHRLKPDEGGVLREAESTRLASGLSITLDPVLGLVLVDQDRVMRLSAGQPWELKLLDSLDSRVGRPSGVKEATIHRFMTTDADADGLNDVILSDDLRHQLTILGRTDEGLKPLISWPVFEDQSYPYGGVQQTQVSEPRAVLGLNADGDAYRDLAMLCHDRLLIYMARETP